ncbi:hypothetical protein EKG37_12360 [Robertmurraya yapensis]|uniref:Uncharacterized protein n=3 Tax=Bacillaceae TaxID=186817 RepID=A0A431W6G5_9BACI|nr:hypothetical protein [Bacillus yapensis]RTR31082.1 hypothetical protein EKG37_12360 [Bacillus yapensis]TKS95511.1 hypothetical protein FAR12_12360 [Bacillus yapensis]CAH0347338.1 hypothetical protein BCI9360_03734 [Bacillus sp. CECT 9360]
MLVASIRTGLFLIPWLTTFFIPKNEFKKYTPVASFAALLVVIESMLSVPFKWWTVKGGNLNKVFNDLSLILGPFFIGTIWIFRFTFGKFWLYIMVNALMDLFLAYPINWLMQKLRVYKLVNFKSKHIFYTAISFALVIYGFQLFITRSKYRN